MEMHFDYQSVDKFTIGRFVAKEMIIFASIGHILVMGVYIQIDTWRNTLSKQRYSVYIK